jgi:hypothetical protein
MHLLLAASTRPQKRPWSRRWPCFTHQQLMLRELGQTRQSLDGHSSNDRGNLAVVSLWVSYWANDPPPHTFAALPCSVSLARRFSRASADLRRVVGSLSHQSQGLPADAAELDRSLPLPCRACSHSWRRCVRGRANVIVSGGAGSGKTTLLGMLSSSIPDGERLITVEGCG